MWFIIININRIIIIVPQMNFVEFALLEFTYAFYLKQQMHEFIS